MNAQQLMAFLVATIAVIKQHVHDPVALAAISQDLGVLSVRDVGASA
jgi:hypothetical protein